VLKKKCSHEDNDFFQILPDLCRDIFSLYCRVYQCHVSTEITRNNLSQDLFSNRPVGVNLHFHRGLKYCED